MMKTSRMPILTVEEMRALEFRASQAGMSYEAMMENAGTGVAQVIFEKYSALANNSCLGLIGPGNNGGDGLITLEQLAKAGWSVTAILSRPRPQCPFVERFLLAGGLLHVAPVEENVVTELVSSAGLILDALLGTGTRLPLSTEFSEILKTAKASPQLPSVIALDCPSGVACDSGRSAEETLKAELTICIEACKQGLLQFPASAHIGQLELVQLDLPPSAYLADHLKKELITPQLASSLLPQRPDNSHKGTFGRALVIAGSRQFTGAASLSLQSALRSGVGLVYAAIPESINIPLAASIPEVIWFPLPEKEGAFSADAGFHIPTIFADKDAVLVGPGLSQTHGTQTFLLSLLQHLRVHNPELPLVVDADALNILSQQPDWPSLLPKKAVLTPHEMEFSRLTGLPLSEIGVNRFSLALSYAQKWQQTLILKGANTLVISPQGDCRVLPFANSVLAHGGTGDVLAGLIVSLLAQNLAPFDAATLAVWLHVRAAELALDAVGHPAATLPSDIIRQLGRAFGSI
ncbi:MAG: NAD(P)H-hydrate dehydratase [Anaerolineaceae bacterium]|nr:NAD(P)H-hydrate dehydratase [Anaerolineaceae bacterium]